MDEIKATAEAFEGFGITDDVVETAVSDLLYLDALLGFETGYPHLRKSGFRLPKYLHDYWVATYRDITRGETEGHDVDLLNNLIADGPAPVAA